MQSVVFPKDVTIELSNVRNGSSFVKRKGPRGIFIKKRGDYTLSILNVKENLEGPRIFVSGVSPEQESVILSQLWKQAVGLSRGYRKRLRLVGIGFRGIKQSTSENELSSNSKPTKNQKSIVFPKYRERKINIWTSNNTKSLVLKLGYSHDSGYPLRNAEKDNVQIEISRPEGRTKGTVIVVEGTNPVKVASTSAEIQNLRKPDAYKGKGIHSDGVVLTLKKGKRQG